MSLGSRLQSPLWKQMDHDVFVVFYDDDFEIKLSSMWHELVAHGHPSVKVCALTKLAEKENHQVSKAWTSHNTKIRIINVKKVEKEEKEFEIKAYCDKEEARKFIKNPFWELAPLFPTIITPY